MKRFLSPLLAAAFILVCAATAAAFTDTRHLAGAEQKALEKISSLDILSGYPDGSFRPNNPVSRAEFAKMLCLFAGEDQLHNGEEAFIDVSSQAWYAGWVSRAAQRQWLSGYPGREYRPQAQITQQEIATVLVRVCGLSKEDFSWPEDYITAAREAGFFTGLNLEAAKPATRMGACQMLYNALTQEQLQAQKPAATEVARGVITAFNGGEITVMNGQGQSSAYLVAEDLLPEGLFPGAYVEAQVADNYLIQVEQAFNAEKKAAYWDIALDGSSAVIDGKKYNIEDADIFTVSYTIGKPFSADTFLKAEPIDRSILSLGGRLAAEMAVVLEEEGGVLRRAYMVNASVVINGGRLDVVEGSFSDAVGEGVSFAGRGSGFSLAEGVSMPPVGAFIHYNLKNGEISDWNELYSANASYLPDVSQILNNGGEDAPYAWVRMDGSSSAAKIDLQTTYLPKIISGGGRNSIQLGINESTCVTYWLAEGCLVYEVKGGNISSGSKSLLEKGRPVIALVNRNADICYVFCLMD